MTNSKTPKIRFKGFTDDWEQRRLNEVAQITMGQSPDGSTYSETPSDYILVQGNADLKDGWVSPRIWTTQKTKTANIGDLIMSVRAPAGAMGKTAFDVVLGRGVAGIKGNEFLFQTLVKMDDDGYWKKLAAGSTFESINSDTVSNAIIAMPQDIEEQQRIGDYLQRIDNLIALHQRKAKYIFIHAKSVAVHGFSEKLTSVWEQRKLCEIATEITRTNKDSNAPVMMITANYGFIEQSERYAFDNAGDSLKKYIVLKKGEMAYNHGASKLRPYGSCFALTSAENARVPFVYHCFDVGENAPEYVSLELNGKRVESQLRRIVSSGARMDGLLNISYEEYTQVQLMLPSVPEQKAVSNFLGNIEHLITLHQRKHFLNLVKGDIFYGF